MKIGEAVAALGITQGDGVIPVVRETSKGWANYFMDEVSDKELSATAYVPTGTYAAGSITRYEGRKAENLVRINELPFDCDLKDFTGIPKEELWKLPDDALWPLVEAHIEAVEFAFASIGLELHRIVYTGYGLSGVLRLPLHKPEAIPAIQELHRRIIKRVNVISRVILCDESASDAGTRMVRLPGCPNVKGPITRYAKILKQRDGMVSEAQLTAAAGATSTATARIVPMTGKGLDDATAKKVIEALEPHWKSGERHKLALAVSGLFAKAGVPEAQMQQIIGHLSAFDDFRDRAKCVHTTYERVRSGLDVQGFFGLQNKVPVDLVNWLDDVALQIRQANAPILTPGVRRNDSGPQGRRESRDDKPEPEKSFDFSEAPTTALHGWVGAYCALMGPTTEAPVAFHLGTALTISGAVMGRKVSTEYGEPLFANLFSILVGRSGKSRKDTSIKRGTRMLTEPHIDPAKGTITMPEVNIATDVGSAEGLIQVLCDKANTMLYLTEFAKLMGNARRKATGTILPTLMQAWDTPPMMQNTNKANPLEASYPYLTMIAATQPAILADIMGESDISSGFANRLLFFCGQGRGPIANPPSVDWAAGKILYKELCRARDLLSGKSLRLSPAAFSHWEDWYNADYQKHVETPEEEEMRARHADNIRKIALIYAVCDGSEKIELVHLEIAIAVVDWCWENVSRMLPGWGGTVDTKIEAKIRELLTRRESMSKRLLQQYTRSRKWGVREYNMVFKGLYESGVILVDSFGTVTLAES